MRHMKCEAAFERHMMEAEFYNPVTHIAVGPDGPDLDLDFNVPDMGDDRFPASHHLLIAINEFYMDDFDGINSEQAHAMLCAWEYGSAASDLFNKGKNSYARLLYARLIALFIISNASILGEIVSWLSRNSVEDAPIDAIEHWKIIKNFFESTKSKMLAAGATAGIA